MKIGEQYSTNFEDPSGETVATIHYVGHGYVVYSTKYGDYSCLEKIFMNCYPLLIKPKIKRWVNVYDPCFSSCSLWKSREAADNNVIYSNKRVACLEIEFEEGEGLIQHGETL